MKKRGDIALFVLSKMAMVFFILALMSVLIIFSSRERASACSQQASQISADIANKLSQAMNSPLEDERLVVSFSPSLSTSGGRTSSYNITITKRNPVGGGEGLISVSTRSLNDADCSGGAKAYYPNGINFVGALANLDEIALTPSAKESFAGAPSTRTKHLIIIKCTAKDAGRKKFLGLDGCTDYNAGPKAGSRCADFESDEYAACRVSAA
ncbi:hypothetical protein HY993_04890 [Candidatus Micrarchaeota archaeon]|nr:hypothetical protein [Candidatus Micrarchaeota archaeon]